ncbi:MAG: hypothetical protein SGPRY_006144, partial [Prymnesium sp.]
LLLEERMARGGRGKELRSQGPPHHCKRDGEIDTREAEAEQHARRQIRALRKRARAEEVDMGDMGSAIADPTDALLEQATVFPWAGQEPQREVETEHLCTPRGVDTSEDQFAAAPTTVSGEISSPPRDAERVSSPRRDPEEIVSSPRNAGGPPQHTHDAERIDSPPREAERFSSPTRDAEGDSSAKRDAVGDSLPPANVEGVACRPTPADAWIGLSGSIGDVTEDIIEPSTPPSAAAKSRGGEGPEECPNSGCSMHSVYEDAPLTTGSISSLPEEEVAHLCASVCSMGSLLSVAEEEGLSFARASLKIDESLASVSEEGSISGVGASCRGIEVHENSDSVLEESAIRMVRESYASLVEDGMHTSNESVIDEYGSFMESSIHELASEEGVAESYEVVGQSTAGSPARHVDGRLAGECSVMEQSIVEDFEMRDVWQACSELFSEYSGVLSDVVSPQRRGLDELRSQLLQRRREAQAMLEEAHRGEREARKRVALARQERSLRAQLEACELLIAQSSKRLRDAEAVGATTPTSALASMVKEGEEDGLGSGGGSHGVERSHVIAESMGHVTYGEEEMSQVAEDMSQLAEEISHMTHVAEEISEVTHEAAEEINHEHVAEEISHVIHGEEEMSHLAEEISHVIHEEGMLSHVTFASGVVSHVIAGHVTREAEANLLEDSIAESTLGASAALFDISTSRPHDSIAESSTFEQSNFVSRPPPGSSVAEESMVGAGAAADWSGGWGEGEREVEVTDEVASNYESDAHVISEGELSSRDGEPGESGASAAGAGGGGIRGGHGTQTATSISMDEITSRREIASEISSETEGGGVESEVERGVESGRDGVESDVVVGEGCSGEVEGGSDDAVDSETSFPPYEASSISEASQAEREIESEVESSVESAAKGGTSPPDGVSFGGSLLGDPSRARLGVEGVGREVEAASLEAREQRPHGDASEDELARSPPKRILWSEQTMEAITERVLGELMMEQASELLMTPSQAEEFVERTSALLLEGMVREAAELIRAKAARAAADSLLERASLLTSPTSSISPSLRSLSSAESEQLTDLLFDALVHELATEMHADSLVFAAPPFKDAVKPPSRTQGVVPPAHLPAGGATRTPDASGTPPEVPAGTGQAKEPTRLHPAYPSASEALFEAPSPMRAASFLSDLQRKQASSGGRAAVLSEKTIASVRDKLLSEVEASSSGSHTAPAVTEATITYSTIGRERHVHAWANLLAAMCNEAMASLQPLPSPVAPDLQLQTVAPAVLAKRHAEAQRDALDRLSKAHDAGRALKSSASALLSLDEEAQAQAELKDVKELEAFVVAERERQRNKVHVEVSEAVLQQLLVDAVEGLPS